MTRSVRSWVWVAVLGLGLQAGGAAALDRPSKKKHGTTAAAQGDAGSASASVPKPSADKARKGPMQYRLSLNDEQRDALTDQKRDQVIEQLQRIAAKFDDDSPQKAEMLFQLSEYYWEKSKYLFRTEMARYDAAYKKYEAAKDRGEAAALPKEDHAPSEKYRALTMGIYQKLLSDYPDYERRDEVLFSLAFNLYETGKNAAAVKRYEELIARYPRSKFVPDAYIQLGNHYFDHNDLARATSNYQKALATKIPKIYSYALYKLAWCDFNVGAFDKSRKKLEEVVDFAENRGKEMVDLRNEALNDLVVIFSQLDRADEAMAYFQRKATGGRQHRLIAKTAAQLEDAGHHENAIRIFRYLIGQTPTSPDAPEWQQAIVRAFEGLRQRNNVRQEVKRLAELYRPGSAWWAANAAQKDVLRNGFNVSEEAMRNIVTEYHQEAQKTKQVETYKLARDIYKQYVNAFASSSDPDYVSDYAFNLRFYYAEILWTLEDWPDAAAAYDAVVEFKIPARETAKEVANEHYRLTAAYDAILAYDKLVKIEKGELEKSDLKDGQKVDESRGKGKVDRGGKLVRRSTAELQETPLTEYEQRLVAACDRYTARFPNPKDEIDIRYQAAVVLYDRNHFVDAAKRFGDIILKWPEEKRSQQAADLTLAVLESKEEWKELNRLSRQFLANKRLARPGSEFAERVANIVMGSQYRYVDEVLYKKEKKPAEAAEGFLAFVREFPKSEHSDQALTYAMLIFQEANQNDRSIAAGERVLGEYPDSPLGLKVRYTLAHLYEHVADYRRAAEAYEGFIAAYDRADAHHDRGPQSGRALAKSKRREPVASLAKVKKGRRVLDADEQGKLLDEAAAWLPDAQFNAALWWEGLGKSDKAIAAYEAYIERFRDRKDVPEIAYNIGLIHEKDRKWKEAARAFEAFNKTYARDSRTTGAQHYLATYHQMRAEAQLHDARETEKLGQELVHAHARLSAVDKQDGAVLNAYANARFQAIEPLWKAYTDVKFNHVATIKADLNNKQRKLKELERAYLEILSIGAGEEGIAALTRIGLAYADLAQNIRNSPDPKGLSEDQKQLYRGELENLAMPLEDKSVEALEKGLAKAYELSIYNAWTLQAQDQVNRFHPGNYEPIRDVSYQGSEFFVTAPLDRNGPATGRATVKETPLRPAAPSPSDVSSSGETASLQGEVQP